jgi:polysaccharide export outer membrane protein
MNMNTIRMAFAAVWFATLGLFIGAAPALAQNTAAAQNAYRLAAGDVVKIQVFQNAELALETRINEAGSISFPLIGNVSIGGLTVTQAEQRIGDALRTGNFVKQPQVTLNVVQVRGHQVSVLGQVGKPGRYPLESSDTRLSDIIATAGGILPGGSDVVVLTGTRDGKPYKADIDMPVIFGQGKRESDAILKNGDVIWVERAPVVYVYGEVQRPGAMRLERNMTLMQVLASAGGLTQRGTERGLRLNRRDAQGNVRVLEPKMTDVIQPDDVVFLRESIF